MNAGAAARAGRAPSHTNPAGRLIALLCSEFGDDPQIRAGSIAWNELRAAAVFESASADALARSTAEWQETVRALVAEIAPELDAPAVALTLTALVEGLSGRWLTAQITSTEAQATVQQVLIQLGLTHTETH
ncbi:TetR family transcriptional regulator C-terminal domain-containing protein [Leucobacter coleopterorum]|uniref:TetR family transcriptional regulator C-terminal domain-containing protein n=1 Tax=Leucobacter coleopterorum TaxID=2714933 RepID=UPI001FCC3ED8|nr:TetR family transcriptional regulator C-terminal domain-containing protein [Leucobacter coleopterorum]